jgi:hypothetical protein
MDNHRSLRNNAWATFHLQQLLGYEHLTTNLHYLKYANIPPQKRRQAIIARPSSENYWINWATSMGATLWINRRELTKIIDNPVNLV